MKNSKILVVGAGGFIGGHLVNKLLQDGNSVTSVDIKPLDLWFQKFENSTNLCLDMKIYDNCEKVSEGVDYILNMACNMGGIGFIENNKAECMLSVLINTNLLLAAKKFNIKKYFFSSSACAYNTKLQENSFISGLKEEDAYPAYPEDGYGWEKLFSERMCRHFFEDFGLKTYVARYHNIYGPYGTYDGGREKSPAAICRKVIKCLNNQNTEIEIWRDGEQTRSFLYIDDCVEATLRLYESDFHDPINIGSEEQVSINQMTDMIFNFSKLTGVKKKYLSDKPKGVRGRSSNNDLIKEILNWNYNFSLNEGLKNTYDWILKDIQSSGSKSNFILP